MIQSSQPVWSAVESFKGRRRVPRLQPTRPKLDSDKFDDPTADQTGWLD
ncbi:MAG: hypothetical protein GY696_11445 [Gammaproteobacteria bacterium]|nr:hypothetical protein [Gammaproteobacteria bacterium]